MSAFRFACAAVLAAVVFTPPSWAAGHLYVLIVADTKGEGLTLDAAHDRDNVKALLSGGVGDDSMTINVLEAENATKDGVLKFFPQRSLGQSDSVFCYLTCHGATDPQTKEQGLQLTGSGNRELLRRGRLREALQGTGAGLVILITDACSSYINLPPEESRITFKAIKGKTILPAYQRLFFDAKGLVDINAAYEGSCAFSDENYGGVFTRSLRNCFEDNDFRNDPGVTWPKLCIAMRQASGRTFLAWKAEAVKPLRADKEKGKLSKQDEEALVELEQQKIQEPQVYFVPGTKLGLQAKDQDADGAGVRVLDLTFNSPARMAGVRVRDMIIGVNGTPVINSDDWDALMDPILASGKAEFTLTVVRTNKKMDIVVNMVPR